MHNKPATAIVPKIKQNTTSRMADVSGKVAMALLTTDTCSAATVVAVLGLDGRGLGEEAILFTVGGLCVLRLYAVHSAVRLVRRANESSCMADALASDRQRSTMPLRPVEPEVRTRRQIRSAKQKRRARFGI
jgi:hypothetical protein